MARIEKSQFTLYEDDFKYCLCLVGNMVPGLMESRIQMVLLCPSGRAVRLRLRRTSGFCQ